MNVLCLILSVACLQVARIQFQVHETLARTSVNRNLMQEKTEALKMLDSKLIDISQVSSSTKIDLCIAKRLVYQLNLK